MMPEIQSIPGGERLIEYETGVTMMLEEKPIVAVCQYSAHDFSGDLIMDILKVHPFIVVGKTVIRNPSYTPPQNFTS